MCLTSFYLQQRIRKDLKGKKDFHFELRSNRNWVYFLPWNNQNDRQTDRQNIWNSGFQTISGNERQLLRERKTRTLPFPKLSATQGFPGCNTGRENPGRAQPILWVENSLPEDRVRNLGRPRWPEFAGESTKEERGYTLDLELCRRSPSSMQHNWPTSVRKLTTTREINIWKD